jgi:3-hydroxyisobutyrate dehydrogenase-like beta-hydroxyacid dehydrogenase
MKVGFIGLGVMGFPMAKNIHKQFEVYGYTKDPETLKDVPFELLNNARDLVEKTDVFITMVTKDDDVLSIFNEIKDVIKKDQIWLDMTTIGKDTSVYLAKAVKDLGARYVDAPVVRSLQAAIDGTLAIYVGGEEALFDKVYPILTCVGIDILYMGDNGAGITMKLLHNILLGHVQNGVNEIMSVASKLGLDLKTVQQAVSFGGAENTYIKVRGENIVNGTYPTSFSIKNMHKDMLIGQRFLQAEGMTSKTIDEVVKVYQEAMQANYAEDDFSITYEIIKKRLK